MKNHENHEKPWVSGPPQNLEIPGFTPKIENLENFRVLPPPKRKIPQNRQPNPGGGRGG